MKQSHLVLPIQIVHPRAKLECLSEYPLGGVCFVSNRLLDVTGPAYFVQHPSNGNGNNSIADLLRLEGLMDLWNEIVVCNLCLCKYC